MKRKLLSPTELKQLHAQQEEQKKLLAAKLEQKKLEEEKANKKLVSPKQLLNPVEEEVVEIKEEVIVPKPQKKAIDVLHERVEKLAASIQKPKYYDEEIARIEELLESKVDQEDYDLSPLYIEIQELKGELLSLPEVRYYDEEISNLQNELNDLEIKYYDDEISYLQERINSIIIPEVKYYDKDIHDLQERIDHIKISNSTLVEKQEKELKDLKNFAENLADNLNQLVIPEEFDPSQLETHISSLQESLVDIRNEISNLPEVKYYENELNSLTEMITNVKDCIPTIPEIKYYDDELNSLLSTIEEVRHSIPELPEVRYYENEIAELEKQIQEVENKIPELPEIKSYDNDIVTLENNIVEIKKSLFELQKSFSEIKIPEIPKQVDWNEDIQKIYEEIKNLKETPVVQESTDPLVPLDQKFATLDDLQNHYRIFINRIQQQLASLGGGGEVRLNRLDDVSFDNTVGSLLIYDGSKWTGISSSAIGGGGGGGGGTANYADVAGIATYATTAGIATVAQGLTGTPSINVGLTTASRLIVGSGTTFPEDLVVEGNARVTGILTIGTASVTIDGDNNTITAGDVFITGSTITLGDNITLNAGATGINSAPNVLYVAKDGNDTNNGTSIDNAKLTIAGAVAISTAGTTIKVLSGTYNENNPIEVPPFVSIVGDSLKTVTIVPNNATQDIFYLNKGTYLSQMTFSGHTAPAAAVAFPPNVAENTGGGAWESPYVQNCTSNTTTGTGMRIDGDLAEGLKSMVVDSYTQYNQGGVGIAITNKGYAQLVSVFTICCNEGITAHKGGQCSLTNSNTDFGTYGLVADGVSDLQFTGVASTSTVGTNSVTVAITTSTRPYEGQVVYFGTLYKTVTSITVTNGGSGYVSTPSVTVSSPSGPNGVTATAFAVLTNGSVSEIILVNSGNQYTETPTVTISAPDTGVTAEATAVTSPIYYTINSSTPIVSGITTVTIEENLNNTISTGTTAYFQQVSRITASSHTFEYVGSGTDITTATPIRGGVAIQENEIIERNGGRVVFTSTDQSGNFRIGNDIVINQNNGTITGRAFTRSLFNQMTPFILALS